MGIHSEKCIVRRFCHCLNITECASRSLDGTHSLLHTQAAWYGLMLLSYKPVQYVTVLNAVGNLMCCTTTLQHLHSTGNASSTADTSSNERLCIRSTVVSCRRGWSHFSIRRVTGLWNCLWVVTSQASLSPGHCMNQVPLLNGFPLPQTITLFSITSQLWLTSSSVVTALHTIPIRNVPPTNS